MERNVSLSVSYVAYTSFTLFCRRCTF